MYFETSQVAIARQAFLHAEGMSARHFRLSDSAIKDLRYDVKTLAHLEKHEVKNDAFAHLCRYRYKSEKKPDPTDDYYFYRICLQDNRIIDAVKRTNYIIKFPPLMLYIAVHELVHIIRFDGGEGRFDGTLEEKEQEERRVHSITREMLSSLTYPDLELVLDCFSDRHRIDNLLN